MKEYKNIDELFKEGISGFAPPPPSDKVWAGIEKATFPTAATKKITYSKWMIAAIILLFVGSFTIWFFPFSGNQTDVSKNEYLSEETNINTNKNQNLSEQKLSKQKHNNPSKNEFFVNEENIEKTNNELPFENDRKEVSNLIVEKPFFVSGGNEESDKEILDVFDIQKMNSKSIYEIAYLDENMIDKQITLEEYLKKRKKLHTYSGLGIKAAMAYYPNTQDQFTYTAEANFGIILNKFYIETGVGYQHMKERGIYKYTYKSNDSIGYYNRVVSFDFDPLNPDNITFKTSQTTVYDSIVHINEEAPLFNYTYLNIPLKLGYRIWEKDKFSLGLETGLIFSKMLSKEIPIAVFNNHESSLLKIDDNTPKRVDVNLQMLVAIRFNYKFSRAISLSVQPEFTKYLNSVYDTKIGDPNIKPYTMGMKFGIYYDF
jgi:hypothetical protein